MSADPVTKAFFKSLLVLAIACFFAACIKNSVRPKNNYTSSKSDSGSMLATDTLPSFYSPSGVAVDVAGNIYVADYGNNMIRKISASGLVSTLAGSGIEGSVNATGVLASFNRPSGVAVDPSGNIYVADYGNNAIRQISPLGVVTTLAGSDSTGSADSVGIKATFFSPADVALDAAGNLYVADAANNLIRMVTQAGVVSTIAGNPTNSGTSSILTLSNPTGIAIDRSGNIFVANFLNNNILQLNATGEINLYAGTGAAGNTNGPAANATFYFPRSVAIDAFKNVYVADATNNLIRKITSNGIVSTLAGSGVAGAADSTGTAASFNGPAGLAVDGAGNIYVADSNNNKIRKVTPAGVVTTIAGNGKTGAKNGQAVNIKNSIKPIVNKLRLLLGKRGKFMRKG